jgi:nucleotide-binding universal stress UspA family protein
MAAVLVAIDGSESSLRALRHAMAGAAEIHLVNVQPKADAPALLLHMTQDQIDRAQHAHGESMLADARKILAAAGRAFEAHVLIGEPAANIAGLAKARAVDSIVMGTRGMTAIGNLTLGSVATKVVHLSPVPVTLVK